MSIISVFSGIFSDAGSIIKKLSDDHSFKVIPDSDIITKAADQFHAKVDVMNKAVYGKPFIFNNFTHEKERNLAYIKTVLAKNLSETNCIYDGFLGHLIPSEISHVLKILVISDIQTRTQNGIKSHGQSEKDVIKKIHAKDESAFLWTQHLFKKEPWDPSLYDIVIPTDKVSIEEAVTLILDSLNKIALTPHKNSLTNQKNFTLAATVEVALARKGHNVHVTADGEKIIITIEKKVLMLSKLEDDLKKIAKSVEGVKEVETKVGKNFYKADIYRQYDFELSPKVLLVDDEREFVKTLSERLQMRDVGTHVVYDGKDALSIVEDEDLEVMVLDLKMPGVDGYEVLEKVKKSKPGIEVIILTGHGSDDDRQRCMELGAFAYLQKPMDIELLTQTMKKAYEKINKEKNKD